MPSYALTLLFTGPPEEVRAVEPSWLRRLGSLRDAGRLRLAGALGADDGVLVLFEAADRLDAEAVARDDPWVEAGLVAWTLREWRELRPTVASPAD